MDPKPTDLTKPAAQKRRKFVAGNLSLVPLPQIDSDFESLVEEWLEAGEANDLSPKTLEGYRAHLANFYWWWNACTGYAQKLGDHPQNVTKKEARQFALYLKKPQNTRWGQDIRPGKLTLSPSTIASYGRAVKVFFNWLEEEGHIEATPFTKAIKFQVKHQDERLIKTVSEDDLKKVFAYLLLPVRLQFFTGRRDLAIIALLLDSGIRRGELLNIKETDLDLTHNQVKVQGKGPERIVHFSNSCREVLKNYIAARNEEEISTDKLWITDKNEPLGNYGFASIIRRLRSATGVNFHAHQLRHTFATIVVGLGIGIADLSKLLGHSSIYTTQIYIHQNSEQLSQVYKPLSPLAHLSEVNDRIKKKPGKPRKER